MSVCVERFVCIYLFICLYGFINKFYDDDDDDVCVCVFCVKMSVTHTQRACQYVYMFFCLEAIDDILSTYLPM